ncbi:hypothetical protein AAE02nite_06890 [Adhaeribacter aerolatus]|uniref:PH domain-containing protein n=2 Tax=Adhaeribacter aerolatus TaxID=670289 RepID=A0A512ATH9_9BACT|nr:hypothetical protein AAE02nite_06890 [Adhaeribacter aerolatus]
MPIYIKLIKTLAFVAVVLYVLRFLITLLSKERSVYVPDPSRHFFMLFWALLCLMIAGPLVVTYIAAPRMSPLEAALLLTVGVILAAFSLPVFALHIQYFFNDFQKLVELDKKNESFKIYDVRNKLFYRKEDIVRATRVKCGSKKFFWSNYEYITFEIRNGSLITLTSLLMPLDKLTKFINSNRIQVEHKSICFI